MKTEKIFAVISKFLEGSIERSELEEKLRVAESEWLKNRRQ
jgi:hypothetical protein